MCLAIPMRIIKIEGDSAIAEAKGVEVRVNSVLVPDIRIDDKVIIHAGFIIERLDEKEAEATEEIWREYERTLEKK
jgi:hydrogenase expression/formation protein HypC